MERTGQNSFPLIQQNHLERQVKAFVKCFCYIKHNLKYVHTLGLCDVSVIVRFHTFVLIFICHLEICSSGQTSRCGFSEPIQGLFSLKLAYSRNEMRKTERCSYNCYRAHCLLIFVVYY